VTTTGQVYLWEPPRRSCCNQAFTLRTLSARNGDLVPIRVLSILHSNIGLNRTPGCQQIKKVMRQGTAIQSGAPNTKGHLRESWSHYEKELL